MCQYTAWCVISLWSYVWKLVIDGTVFKKGIKSVDEFVSMTFNGKGLILNKLQQVIMDIISAGALIWWG